MSRYFHFLAIASVCLKMRQVVITSPGKARDVSQSLFEFYLGIDVFYEACRKVGATCQEHTTYLVGFH